MTVQERLRSQRAPEEAEAQERVWRVLQAAFEEQRPSERARPLRSLRLVAVGAVVIAALAAGGGAVAGLIDDALEDEKAPAPPRALRLPAAGKLLVQSEQGPWVVRRDGSKRLLGGYDGASWSPRGLFVVAWRAGELVALEPGGELRWTVVTREPADARWSPSGFRIAYRSGATMRVVAGDGTGDRALIDRVGPAAPAWRPGSGHVVAAADRGGRVLAVDADSGRVLWRSEPGERARAIEWSADGRRIVVLSARAVRVLDGRGRTLTTRRTARAAAFAPSGRRLALVRGSEVVIGSRTVFAGAGVPGELAWSPDGRWLLVALPDANQWVFVRPDGRRLVTTASVAQQFDPGATTSGRFPRLGGWAP